MSLKHQIELYKSYVYDHPDAVSDIASTLALHREKLPHRSFAIWKDGELLETSSLTKAAVSPPSLTMIFSGQGAQWPQMGTQLISTSASFRSDLEVMDGMLQNLKRPPSWSILGMLNPVKLINFY